MDSENFEKRFLRRRSGQSATTFSLVSSSIRTYPKNLRLAAYNMCSFPPFAARGFCPSFLEADVDGGMDDGSVFAKASTRRVRAATEENEFRFVEDAFGLNFRLVGHSG